MIVFFVGAPASGKTVLARDFADRCKFTYSSSGKIAAELGESDPRIEEMLSQGQYAPADLMDRLMVNHIRANGNYQVVDGYPRYFEQLADILSTLRSDLYFVITECEAGELSDRHAERKRTNTGTFEQRMAVYQERTLPMIQYLKKHDRTVVINTSVPRTHALSSLKNGINRINGYTELNIPLIKV